MMNRLVFVFALFAGLAFGQQDAQYSQYYNNMYFFNPAAGGLTNTIQFESGFRRQWMNLEGSPFSTFISGHSQIRFDKFKSEVIDEFNLDKESSFATPANSIGRTKHIVGGFMALDQIGPFQKNSIMGSYAYHIQFTKKTMLGLGLRAGWSNFGINSSKVILHDEDDIEYANFFSRNSNQSIFDVQAGLTWYGENFVVGVSSTQLLQNDLVIDQIITQSTYGRHWFTFGMVRIPVNDDYTLEPHFMLQTISGAPMSLNVGSRVHYKNRYWANVAYRISDAINVGVGMNLLGNFRFGYSYDFSAGAVQRFNNSVHELMIGYVMGNNRNLKKELDTDKKD
jgi:type IX secretion system PorP/SprF family membrane protein